MRMKGDDRRRPPRLPRPLHDPADDGLMPDVHAVEVADGGDAAAGEVGLAERVVEDEHGAGEGYDSRNDGTGTAIPAQSGSSSPSHSAKRPTIAGSHFPPAASRCSVWIAALCESGA